MRMVYAPDETWMMALGEARAINTGFPSAIEAEGWQWDEAPDIASLLALPLPPRMVLAVPIPAFTAAADATIRQLTSALALPVVVFSPECAPAAIQMALHAGADDFLPLPVMIEEMVARLAAVIRVRFGVQNDLYVVITASMRRRISSRLSAACHSIFLSANIAFSACSSPPATALSRGNGWRRSPPARRSGRPKCAGYHGEQAAAQNRHREDSHDPGHRLPTRG